MNPDFLIPIAQIVVGLLLLFFGRQLFWLFVGGVGFLAGLELAVKFAAGQPAWLVLLIALAGALLGAVLAVVLQRAAVAIAGGLAGGMLAVKLAEALGFGTGLPLLAAFVLGAIVAAILISALFDWALIVLSASTGAVVLQGALPIPDHRLGYIAALILFVMGLAFQIRTFLAQPPASSEG